MSSWLVSYIFLSPPSSRISKSQVSLSFSPPLPENVTTRSSYVWASSSTYDPLSTWHDLDCDYVLERKVKMMRKKKEVLLLTSSSWESPTPKRRTRPLRCPTDIETTSIQVMSPHDVTYEENQILTCWAQMKVESSVLDLSSFLPNLVQYVMRNCRKVCCVCNFLWCVGGGVKK